MEDVVEHASDIHENTHRLRNIQPCRAHMHNAPFERITYYFGTLYPTISAPYRLLGYTLYKQGFETDILILI